MTTRKRIGDVYEVALGEDRFAYFQHVCDDESQLSSAVIRVFNCVFADSERPELSTLPELDVKFHAHVFLAAGRTLGVWRKVGRIAPPNDTDILFRSSRDYGNPAVNPSFDWEVWRTNGPRTRVGRLPEQYFDAEIGVVKAPQEIVKRILTGNYSPYKDFR